MDDKEYFTIYWRNGTRKIISGPAGSDIATAFMKNGFAGGFFSAIDFYNKGKDPEDLYTWDKTTQLWNKNDTKAIEEGKDTS